MGVPLPRHAAADGAINVNNWCKVFDGYTSKTLHFIIEKKSKSRTKWGFSTFSADPKYDVYEESGVKEYWIVDPQEKAVQIFVLVNGKFVNSDRFLFDGDHITSPVLLGFSLDVAELFDKL